MNGAASPLCGDFSEEKRHTCTTITRLGRCTVLFMRDVIFGNYILNFLVCFFRKHKIVPSSLMDISFAPAATASFLLEKHIS